MCGIAGYFHLDGSPADRASIERMVSALKHRGPDAQTVHLDGPVGLGHARLSIIDLAGGHQPLFNEDHSIAVVCNGEIYNYRELREQLIRKGHRFQTGSDCEVLAHQWEESGPGMLALLRGMFAFILYDRRQGIVFGARDRFGQKPLYYYQGQHRLAFASEIKGLLVLPEISRELDPLGLDQFLFHQFVPQPRTLFRQIQKLEAGCSFELRLPTANRNSSLHRTDELESQQSQAVSAGAGAIRFDSSALPTESPIERSTFTIQKYWRPTFAPDDSLSRSEHLTRVEAALMDAVQSHLVSDVPIGLFLSGGIDSSLITALASRMNPEPLQTFSISFPGSEHDEAPYARTVANTFRTRHHEFPFAPADMRQALTAAATLFDQPLADLAVLPLMALSQAASEHVKVVLTGDGGDELFAGYRKYKRTTGIPGRFRWLSQFSNRLFPISRLAACGPDRMGWRKLQSRLAMVLAPACRSEYQRQSWEGWERFALYRPELSELIGCQFASLSQSGEHSTGLSPLNAALELDQGTVLADRLLLKGDYATMAFGLEARAPLLDHQLAEVASHLPTNLKASPQTTKIALREIARRYLPADIIERRKKGFSMPVDRWFRGELRDWTRSCLLDDSVTLPRYFQRGAIERLLSEHAAGQNHSARIHTLLTFELWSRAYAS